jgi:hypothetical protein
VAWVTQVAALMPSLVWGGRQAADTDRQTEGTAPEPRGKRRRSSPEDGAGGGAADGQIVDGLHPGVACTRVAAGPPGVAAASAAASVAPPTNGRLGSEVRGAFLFG